MKKPFLQFVDILREDSIYFALQSLYKIRVRTSDDLKKILVNGSPKTGTTWMHKLITSMPGYRPAGHFHGEFDRYQHISPGGVAHGHDRYGPELGQILESNGIETVLLIRDPRDQLISRAFHIKRDPNHIWHEKFNSISVEEAIWLCIEGREGLPSTVSMIELTQSWLKRDPARMIAVRYESMINNPVQELERVLSFLGIPHTLPLIKTIVNRNRFERLTIGKKFWKPMRRQGEGDAGSHFRKGIIGDWKNYLDQGHVDLLKRLAGELLIELGYEKDLNWSSL